MPTFSKKSEVNDSRIKSNCYEDLGPKNHWKFRTKLNSLPPFSGWIRGPPPRKSNPKKGEDARRHEHRCSAAARP
ncbi:hypothetical protein SBV1_2460010 [Verrucomicrobia bacterium]|nr:hypothetical protein SBV1_2460010 [Verrucomicrobiota bacterium]